MDGFSKQTVYNKITDESRVLLLDVVVTKPTLFENRRKLQNKAPESLVNLLKVYYPCKQIMKLYKVRFFLYFVIMVRNSQNFSPC